MGWAPATLYVQSVNLSAVINDSELALIETLSEFPNTLEMSSNGFSPALLANYTYVLVKNFNSFYQSSNIMKESDKAIQGNRMVLVKETGAVIKKAMNLLGIDVPDQM